MDSKQKRVIAQIKKQKKAFIDGNGEISLTHILQSEPCQQALNGCREFRDRVYTPMKTVFTFIKQVLNEDKSCKNAVAGVVAERLAMGEEEISTGTGAYVKARQRLPEEAVHELVKESGESQLQNAPMQWKPFGRELKVFDGTTVIMADTKENQATFPQHKNQKAGVGFPIARVVAVMSLTLGTVLDYSIDAYKGKGTGESSLLRRIFDCIKKDDIVLGDRYFPNFFLMSSLGMIGADGIFRGQSQRHYDFRTGEYLEKNDHIATWRKPAKPKQMSQEEYDSHPDEIRIREFKIDGNVYVTTFLNYKKYHKKELATIYKRRWEVEINLKSIKSIMQMDMLSCKTPDMITKEIGIHFLAYNFIRIIMSEACAKHDALPWKTSFKGTLQLLENFTPYFLKSTEKENKKMYSDMLRLIVKNKIGNRPGRVEPRAVKQRSKPFSKLNKPRSIEKARLMKKINKKILKYAAAA